jgi:hypothetical protein
LIEEIIETTFKFDRPRRLPVGSTNVFVQFFRAPNLVIGRLVTLHRRLRVVSFFAPSRPVFHNPINQGTFKTYVVASFLAFNPFVTKDLSAFG